MHRAGGALLEVRRLFPVNVVDAPCLVELKVVLGALLEGRGSGTNLEGMTKRRLLMMPAP